MATYLNIWQHHYPWGLFIQTYQISSDVVEDFSRNGSSAAQMGDLGKGTRAEWINVFMGVRDLPSFNFLTRDKSDIDWCLPNSCQPVCTWMMAGQYRNNFGSPEELQKWF